MAFTSSSPGWSGANETGSAHEGGCKCQNQQRFFHQFSQSLPKIRKTDGLLQNYGLPKNTTEAESLSARGDPEE
jgi:hypothetical protein